jgi:ribose transport system permease protein
MRTTPPGSREGATPRQRAAALRLGARLVGAYRIRPLDRATLLLVLRRYAVLLMLVILFVVLSFASSAFLSAQNLLNIVNEQSYLAIVAAAGTLVIVSGGFDLSTGAIAQVANVCAAWIAVHDSSPLGLIVAPILGLGLGILNGIIITRLRVHSFLATLASSLVYSGLALLITNGFLISVGDPSFTVLGQGSIGPLPIAVVVFVAFFILATVLLHRTVLGRYIFAVGGNREAAELSGVRVDLVTIAAFAFSGLASGLAAAILVSRVASGEPQTGSDIPLNAIAAVILGGTSIYGGEGAVWRSVAGVFLLALIDNGFDLLSANPFYKYLVTGVVIVSAVALSAAGGRRR